LGKNPKSEKRHSEGGGTCKTEAPFFEKKTKKKSCFSRRGGKSHMDKVQQTSSSAPNGHRGKPCWGGGWGVFCGGGVKLEVADPRLAKQTGGGVFRQWEREEAKTYNRKLCGGKKQVQGREVQTRKKTRERRKKGGGVVWGKRAYSGKKFSRKKRGR